MTTIVKYDASGLSRLIKGLRSLDGEVNKAVARSINRTMTTARKEITMRVRADYNVKAAGFKKGLSITRANWRNPESILKAEGGPGVPLIDFQARARVTPSRIPSTRWTGNTPHKIPTPRGGVSGVVRRKRGRKQWTGAFVARLKSGHVGVFKRRFTGISSKRALKELYGPSAVRILTGNRYTEDIETLVNETMAKNMARETKNILRKLGR